MNFGIIVVAYNRIKSFERLLKFLSRGFYDHGHIDLIISVDKSDQEEIILSIANNYNWHYGNKIIKSFPEKIGLRNHIISCGNLTRDYDAIVVFEDDVVPSVNFMNYVIGTLDKYGSDPNIGGISLYSPCVNDFNLLPFYPFRNEFDNYFMQRASSLGQCWNKRMWDGFIKWYEKSDILINDNDMPGNIYRWPETSWKKYYMKYLVVHKKYFVYPYDSLTTNFSDAGQHIKFKNKSNHAPIGTGKNCYKFCDFDAGIKYDVFFERNDLVYGNGNAYKSICCDIYGNKIKSEKKQYLLTIKNLDFKIIEGYCLELKPHELNFVYGVKGEDLYLYDLRSNDSLNIKKSVYHDITYYYVMSYKNAIRYGFYSICMFFKYRFYYIYKMLSRKTKA